MSAIGTWRTLQPGRPMSAFGVKRASELYAAMSVMTRLRHRLASHVAVANPGSAC